MKVVRLSVLNTGRLYSPGYTNIKILPAWNRTTTFWTHKKHLLCRSCVFKFVDRVYFYTVTLKIPHTKYSAYVLQHNTEQTLQLYIHRPTDRISLTKAKLLCVRAFFIATKKYHEKRMERTPDIAWHAIDKVGYNIKKHELVNTRQPKRGETEVEVKKSAGSRNLTHGMPHSNPIDSHSNGIGYF